MPPNPAEQIYLIGVIAAFSVFGVSLFGVWIYARILPMLAKAPVQAPAAAATTRGAFPAR